MTAWQIRESQHAKERMEMLKLYRSQGLADYSAQSKPPPRSSNFMQQSIGKAYDHLLGDDDD